MISHAVVMLLAAAVMLSAEDRPLLIYTAGYPRAFFFRSAEGAAANPKTGYEEWSSNYGRLMGIMGKCLDEEVLGREARNPEFFTRYKTDHPSQAVLLHCNGNARDPRYTTEKFFAGHWIYEEAQAVTADIPAVTEDTVISVENASRFQTNMGLHKNKNDDVAIFEIAADGKTHDWENCEQAVLMSKDHRNNTITVRRGQYGTKPRAFQKGRTRVAAHATEGPWGAKNNLLWFYNYSTHCPRDREGKTAADRCIDDLAERFSPRGMLAALDGLEFDVLFSSTKGDTDGDGIVDNGVVNGNNAYGIGTYRFLSALRRRMGETFIIMADGALGDGGTHSQRGFGIINGIESEGWPDLRDNTIDDWSGGMNRQFFWRDRGRAPAFSYINHKFTVPAGTPGDTKNADVPFSTHRLVFAAACMFDAAITYAFTPEKEKGETIGIWDELKQGQDGHIGWLGKPEGDAVRMALKTTDLLAGQGNPIQPAFAARIQSPGSVTSTPDGIRIHARGTNNVLFTVGGIPASAGDLFLSLTASAETMKGYPPGYARAMWVATGGDEQRLTVPGAVKSGICERGKTEADIDEASGAFCRFIPAFDAGGEKHTAVAVHPPYKRTVGHTFWEREAVVPADGVLVFYTTMGAKSPGKSDGVLFQVQVSENGSPFTKVFEHLQKEHRWVNHRVPLGNFAGKTLRLKFIADCGPADNAVTDHAYWGDAAVCEGNAPVRSGVHEQYMSWLDEKPFTAGFYFRNTDAGNMTISVNVEGSESILLRKVSAHVHADAFYRVFENGIVFANPSAHAYTFDLAAISPGREYRRLSASSKQDTAVNNGKHQKGPVILGALDALFLIRMK
ncbi:MAG: hypothetical protein HZC28_15920 [Spirochaetes bacterium]|nr:hypothetical protein [Spirochaetota bacterium]